MKLHEQRLGVIISIIATCALPLLLGCKKQNASNGIISVSVSYKDKATDHGWVTIISEDGTRILREIDVYGEIWVANLSPGNYTVQAEQRNYNPNSYLRSDTTVQILSRYRMNEYQLELDLED